MIYRVKYLLKIQEYHPYIMTNEEAMINNIEHYSPLGKSDHCVIGFDFICCTAGESQKYRKYYYDRGDYTSMRHTMAVNWTDKLAPYGEDPDKQWEVFAEVLKKAKEVHIPSRNIGQGRRHRRGPPIDKTTYEVMKKKHRAWRRYIETRDDNKYKEFRSLTNKVRKMTRNLQRDMEKDISRSAKTNPEKFWSFIKSKLKTKVRVADLVKIRDNDGEPLTKNDGEKAEVLSEFFSSVFTREPDTNVPTLEPKSFNETLDTIMITKQEVKKKLDKVKIDKSQGPDDVHPRILRELGDEISEALAEIYNTSLTQGRQPNI